MKTFFCMTCQASYPMDKLGIIVNKSHTKRCISCYRRSIQRTQELKKLKLSGALS